ncbi:MAG: PorT family protein [Saprospirales bacterium]|nr:MAG: PorT family protein [Saprospirales bacterium]
MASTNSLLKSFLALAFAACFSNFVFSQVFETKIWLGSNFSHIQGDGLSGLKKTGLHAGIGLSSDLGPKIGWNIDLLYNRRGSSNRFRPGKHRDHPGISLHYAEIPMYLAFYDWEDISYEGNPYHRMRFIAGLGVGRLLRSEFHDSFSADKDLIEELEDRFNRTDFNWLIGAGIHLSEKLSLNIRYTRSILPLFDSKKNSDIRARSLLGSFVTINLGFHI